jgi:hypothetical protein
MHHATRRARLSSGALGHGLWGLLVSLVLGNLPAGAADALDSPPVDVPGQLMFQDGQLTAHIRGASLRQVMAEVARLSGVQVRWMDAAVGEQAVSVEFHNLALAEAVRHLLRATNFLLVYAPHGEGTRLTQIWLASRGEGTGPPVLNQPSGPKVPVPQVQTAPVAEAPAEDSKQSLEALSETAMGAADLAARLSAIDELGRHAPADARIRELLMDLADHDPHPQVRDAASMLLGGGR